ncbi:MAG TPA: choice-of-anchor D domain-containing protein [Silvibacterium sp.]|nr:choice-of-anchor D domain-containing protein [Silvibacterium sp.]
MNFHSSQNQLQSIFNRFSFKFSSLALAIGVLSATAFLPEVHAATATATPASITWSKVNVGTAGGPKTATLVNDGGSAISISSIGFVGADPHDFSIYKKTCGSTLAASASCTATILFKPTTSGTRSADLAFADTASPSPQEVAVSGLGAATTSSGTATVSPTSITWGSVAVGNAGGQKTATLTNNGTVTVNMSSIGFTGTNAGDFTIFKNTCGSTLAASASCATTILFKPTTAGTRTATLVYTDDAGNSPQEVSVSGLGTAGTSPGSVTAAPSTLSFGSVSTGSTSASQSIAVSNTTSSSVSLSAASLSGTNAGDFAVTSTTCGSSLAASASCTASIAFKPAAAGSASATWMITSSNSATPLSVALSGTGVAPTGGTLTPSPTSLVWGNVTFGNTSGSKTVTLTNGGSSAVNIDGVSVTGTDSGDFFVSSSTCGSSLAASSSCTATIFFRPLAAGKRTATLSFSDGASNSPQNVPLSGTGLASTSGSVAANPTRLTFPQTQLHVASSSMTAYLMNGGTSTITLSSVSIEGTNASEFSKTSTTCGSSLAPSTSCAVAVAFTPAATGTRTATLSFSDSSSNSPQGVSLSGVGVNSAAGTATASPSSINFGSVAINFSSGSKLVTLTNNDTSTIGISSVSITGADGNDFSVTSDSCGANLAPSKTCSINLIFGPIATGTRTANLTIVDGASNSPQTVALSGTGTPASTTTISISPSSLAWGSQNIGAVAATKTFTITAGGSGSVTFSSIAPSGTNAADYTITAKTCGSTLTAGSSCTVTLSFKPAALGNRVALLAVNDNGIGSPQSAELSGEGAYSAAQTAAVTVDFGSRSGSQVAIPSGILGDEYFESLPTNANRTTVVQAGFTAARYRLQVPFVYGSTTPNWSALDSDMAKFVAAGVHPLIELEETPTFLQPSPLPCPTAPTTSVPTSVTKWGQLAASIVAHFDATFPGLVQEYEIWNEPNTTALCSTNQLNDYISIYAAAAPLMKAQANTDGVTIKIGGPATAGVGFTSILTNASTAPYVDFYSYHFYEGSSNDITNGMTWDGAGGTPSVYSKIINSSTGVQARFLQAYTAVQSAKTPLGAKTPIYFDEYNDDWAFRPECCRNSPTYSPLFNSMTVAQLLNASYHGATTVPSRMIYFSAAQQTFCLLGIVNSAMDCNKAATGAEAQPYPQWYTYEMMFAPSFLDLKDGGHVATSVTLSSSASTAGLIATGYYTSTTDSILVINPTASSFSGVTLQINNSGLTSPTSTLYTINAANPTVSKWPAATISASGGIQTTFDVPPYSVIAVSLK